MNSALQGAKLNAEYWQTRLATIQGFAAEAQAHYEQALAKHYEIEYAKVSTWKCTDSIVGVCVYDDINDEAHDNCIVCHEPEERK